MQLSQFNSTHKLETPTKMPCLRLFRGTPMSLPEYTLSKFPSCTLILVSTRNNSTGIFKLVKIMLSSTCFQVYNKNSFSYHVDFVVNHICRFASTKKKKPRWNFTVACHRHPTGLGAPVLGLANSIYGRDQIWIMVWTVYKVDVPLFYGVVRRERLFNSKLNMMPRFRRPQGLENSSINLPEWTEDEDILSKANARSTYSEQFWINSNFVHQKTVFFQYALAFCNVVLPKSEKLPHQSVAPPLYWNTPLRVT